MSIEVYGQEIGNVKDGGHEEGYSMYGTNLISDSCWW